MDILNIEALVAQNRVVKTADIDPINDYVMIGKWQRGTNKYRGSGNSYASYAVPLSELLGGGSSYTASNGIVLVGADFQLATGASSLAWAPNGNAYGAEKYIGTNDAFDLPFRANSNEVARFTNGLPGQSRLFINASTSIAGSNAGIQYSNAAVANRAQIKLHSYFAGNSIAGVSTLTSRSGTIGINNAVLAGQEYSKWTAQAAATTPGSAPISGTWAFIANTVNSLTVASDYRIQLTNLAGTLGDRLYLTSEGNLGLGISAPIARLHVRGADATAFTSALLVEDSAGNRIQQSRDDGKTFFGSRFCYLSSSNIVSGGEFNMFAEQLFLLDSTLSLVVIEANNKPLRFNTWHGTGSNDYVEFAGDGAAGFESFVRTYDISTSENGFKTYMGCSAASGDTNFKHAFVNGNVHIGYDPIGNADTTKLTIQSRNQLSTQNTLLLQDNTTATLLKVRNDGSINAPLIPSSGTGFPPGGTVAGDLWVDTLTNTVKRV